MLDHVDIRVADRDASEHFYDTVLRALDKERLDEGPEHIDWGEFTIVADLNEHPPSINTTNCNRPAIRACIYRLPRPAPPFGLSVVADQQPPDGAGHLPQPFSKNVGSSARRPARPAATRPRGA